MTNKRLKTGLRRMATACLMCATVVAMTLMSSCSTDYVNVIPKGSTALMSLDLAKMAEQSGMDDNRRAVLLRETLGIDDINDSGIDLNQKVYAFQTADGTLGMVAAVGSKGSLEKWLERLADSQKCTKPAEKKGFIFAVLRNSFVVGYSSDAILVMGPSVGSAQAELQRRMTKWLKADDDGGIRESLLFDKLETMDSSVALVAQAQALPDKFAALFTLGAPKGTTPTDVYIAATMDSDGKGRLEITSESFAFDPTTDKALKDAAAVYKPISGSLSDKIPTDAAVTVACGLDGKTFVKLLHGNNATKALLAGLNTALDIDKMIRSIDGNAVVCLQDAADWKGSFHMVAQTTGADWLADVAYWKTSCPSGTTITNGKSPNTFVLRSPEYTVCFGHNGKYLTISGGEQATNPANGTDKPTVSAAKTAVSAAAQADFKGRKLCAVINMKTIAGSRPEISVVTNVLKPLFGDVETITFYMK